MKKSYAAYRNTLLATAFVSQVSLANPSFAADSFELESKIQDTLQEAKSLDSKNIIIRVGRGVSPFASADAHELPKGTVELTGTVGTSYDKILAEKLTRNIDGVDRVVNFLRVDASSAPLLKTSTISDSTITDFLTTVRSSLTRKRAVSALEENGTVYIEGTVENSDDRKKVEEIAERFFPTNKRVLRLQETFDNSNDSLEKRIRKTIKENGLALPEGAILRVQERKVTLQGDFPSHENVDEILAVIQMVEGVTIADSKVTVSGKAYPLEHRD